MQVHAEFCVVVCSAMPAGPGSLLWRDVSITNRVNIQVTRPCTPASPWDAGVRSPASADRTHHMRSLRWCTMTENSPP